MQNLINKNNIIYGVISLSVMSLMVFVVLPQFPQVNSDVETIDTAVNQAEAWGDSGCGGCDPGGPGDPGDPTPTVTVTPQVSVVCADYNYVNVTVRINPGGVFGYGLHIDGVDHGGISQNGDPKTVRVAHNRSYSGRISGTFGATVATFSFNAPNCPPPVVPPSAKCDFLTANRESVPHGGGEVVLTWGTTGALSVTLNNESVAFSGSKTVNVTQNTTFTINVINARGTHSCVKTITVEPPVAQVAVCDSFTANRTTVPHGGGQVVLTWATTNASGVTINGGSNLPDGSATVTVSSDTTFTLIAIGAGGNDSCTVRVTVEPPVTHAAVCDSFSANTTTVPSGGGNVTLTWATTNATSVSINNGVGTVAADGSRTVNVTSNKTFTLTATGTGGNDTCAVTITVQTPNPVAVCDSFSSTANSVPHGGGDVTLSWATTNATSVSINNGVGTVAADGSRTVRVNSNTTFTLTAVGTGGNDTCTVTITVSQPNAAVCNYLNASRLSVPHGGANVTLTWSTTNATSASINEIGSVSVNGNTSVFVNSNKTFTLTAVGASGNNSTCTVTITKESEPQAPRCDYFRVSDDEVEEGDEVTLSWGTTNASSVSINQGIGNVANNGTKRVEIDRDTTFTLTVNGSNGSDTCTVRVEIEEEERKRTPRCELEVSRDRVNRGDRITLSWETTNVDEFIIKDDRGNTIFDTDDYSSSQVRRYLDGEIDIVINQATEFRMTAEGVDGGDRTCRVDVDVENDIAVYEKRDQALVIALTQVPYTGFEAGAVLTFLFYAVLTLWALFIAYILVIKKGAVLGFSLYGNNNSGMSEADAENRKKVEALVAKYASSSWK